ncbi:MAG: ribokinase [Sulfitobacter sp.]
MIWNLGSINIDRFYRLPHLPAPGETLAAAEYSEGLGGKGANMSVAAARAGAHVAHIGAVGPDGAWAAQRMLEYGVDTRPLASVETATGHANIYVDGAGENSIVLFPGANALISDQMIGSALVEGSTGDFLLMQNETSGQEFAAKTAQQLGFRIAYAAAPFEAEAVKAVIGYVDLLVLNEVEAEQLQAALGKPLDQLGLQDIVVTLGSAGSKWISATHGTQSFDAIKVDPVDTTGAGDTFTGYLVAALAKGMAMPQAISLATKAGALMVTRRGTADVIPDLKEIDQAFG